MSASAIPQPPEGKDELIIVREFRAPRALVFKAWTEAAMLPRWFCPEGCDLPFQRFDPRVGGSYRVCLRGRESGTRMHFHQQRFVSEFERDDHRGGWSSCFNRLDQVLGGP